MTAARLWKAMPWVDTHTGNWSLTRSLAIAIGWCICRYIEKVTSLDANVVFIVALVFLAAFSKNVADFRDGAAVFFRRRAPEAPPAASTETDLRP